MMRPSAERPRCLTVRARPVRSQSGLTLVESLVALMLASVVVLALAAGVLTMLRTTQEVSAAQRTQAALTRAAESVKAVTFTPCADTSTYAGVLPSGASIVTVQHLTPPPAGPGVGTFVPAGSCSPVTDRVQRIQVQVGTATAEIVKRADT
jgi:Tfp pilus assembly protein PilW